MTRIAPVPAEKGARPPGPGLDSRSTFRNARRNFPDQRGVAGALGATGSAGIIGRGTGGTATAGAGPLYGAACFPTTGLAASGDGAGEAPFLAAGAAAAGGLSAVEPAPAGAVRCPDFCFSAEAAALAGTRRRAGRTILSLSTG